MKADPFAQLKLLDVQELDTRIDALSHQLASIPLVVQLRELAGRRTRVDNAVRDLRIQVDDITAEQKRAVWRIHFEDGRCIEWHLIERLATEREVRTHGGAGR